ncbi:MAG: hypothetical protein NTV22_15495 [bacterium]|nr:hypothetical protein [bacterium]
MTPEKTIRITFRNPKDETFYHRPDSRAVQVNGTTYSVPYDKPTDVPTSVYHALKDCGERFDITVHDNQG